MDAAVITGILIVVLGGVMEGLYSLALKITPKWSWEHIWGATSFLALVLIPWPLAFSTVPNLAQAYSETSWGALLAVFGFGAGWGVGGVFFGLGLAALGISLGLSLMMGLIAICGSIVPLIMEHPEQLGRPAGFVMMMGIATMIVGVSTCAKAGQMKDAATRKSAAASTHPAKVSFKVGLLYCLLASVLSALANFGIIFGKELMDAAVRQGAAPADANNAVWGLVFTANYLVNAGYCVFLMARNRNFAKLKAQGTGSYWLIAAAAGAVWAGGMVVYSIGATHLGQYGAFLGFPVMLISSILTGNAIGVFSGEWKGVASNVKRVMVFGVVLLMIAIWGLAYSNTLMA